MNERIKELAEQAGGEFYEGFAGGTNFVKFAEDDFEKFAGLLVRECAVMTRNLSAHGELAEKAVKEHFGVK